MFVVVLDSGESESEKVNLSTWFGSLLRTSASIPAVDWAAQRFKQVKDTERNVKRRILAFETAEYRGREKDYRTRCYRLDTYTYKGKLGLAR